MRKVFILVIVLLLMATPTWAFLYELKMHSRIELSEMTEDQLQDVFIEAKVEEKASAEFHEGAGFSNAKEYNKRKDLLRYIILIRREMQKRDIEAEPVELWLQ